MVNDTTERVLADAERLFRDSPDPKARELAQRIRRILDAQKPRAVPTEWR
jgi:hypothetical protein